MRNRASGARKLIPAPMPALSKSAHCLNLLRQAEGASLQDLMAATGWQAHSLRGFLSGTVRKKMGLHVASTHGEDSIRRWRIIPAGE
ncbi:DUF3489 domain-containing protein [Aestuariivirga sp.]|uniref:DUF3489 domain-containing protein n=1 Tax=Aestuariivirga sp. TaxID=2650926 RepID=UPI003BAAD6D0